MSREPLAFGLAMNFSDALDGVVHASLSGQGAPFIFSGDSDLHLRARAVGDCSVVEITIHVFAGEDAA